VDAFGSGAVLDSHGAHTAYTAHLRLRVARQDLQSSTILADLLVAHVFTKVGDVSEDGSLAG
jgi:hypothetical protein